MLKKLVKYGNSMTLVIDKAILELLNMDKSEMVRLQTNGRSLIVTPVFDQLSGNVHYTELEKLIEKGKKQEEIFKNAPPALKEELNKVYNNIYLPAHEKFIREFALHKEFQKDFEQIKEYAETSPDRYIRELNLLKAKYWPAFAEVEKAYEVISQKYNYPIK